MYIYGQFVEKAVIDGRIVNSISFILNKDKSVSAILPHFWEYAGTT